MMRRVGTIGYKANKFLRIMRSRMLRRALCEYHVAAGVEHLCVLSQLPACTTVIDIGANRGQFALAVRHLLPGASIHSFEPLPGPGKVFGKLFADDAMVHLRPVAIGRKKKRAVIHISGRDDSSSLLPISEVQADLFSGTAEVGRSTIDVGPLSYFLDTEQIRAPALLKVDVQGYELEVLAGSESMIDRFSWVYVECSFVELYEGQAFADEVIAWLREHGFRLRGIYNMAYDALGISVQADFLFERH